MGSDDGKILHGNVSELYSEATPILTFRRYLDPDPLLLATRRGQEGDVSNPRFHALNQAIVQLVSGYGDLQATEK